MIFLDALQPLNLEAIIIKLKLSTYSFQPLYPTTHKPFTKLLVTQLTAEEKNQVQLKIALKIAKAGIHSPPDQFWA